MQRYWAATPKGLASLTASDVEGTQTRGERDVTNLGQQAGGSGLCQRLGMPSGLPATLRGFPPSDRHFAAGN